MTSVSFYRTWWPHVFLRSCLFASHLWHSSKHFRDLCWRWKILGRCSHCVHVTWLCDRHGKIICMCAYQCLQSIRIVKCRTEMVFNVHYIERRFQGEDFFVGRQFKEFCQKNAKLEFKSVKWNSVEN